ncbi:hypothetical protein VIGAN_05182500, partial [Vigna angularis var. angularis]
DLYAPCLLALLIEHDEYDIIVVVLHRGSKRSVWFFAHWILGTAVTFLGVLNVYLGLEAYHQNGSINKIKDYKCLKHIEYW